ncbi:MAG TPA: hypothetical protein VJQ44_03810 [Gemmatimonadales bacterium]|nr:hypothetical protein [Gemmatimonadales bacterium]
MSASRPIPATTLAALLLTGCAAGVAPASRSSAGPGPDSDCSFRAATTCWTLAPRIPAAGAAPRDSSPDQLLTPPRPVLAAKADSAATP